MIDWIKRKLGITSFNTGYLVPTKKGAKWGY
jgi:hypothetical protein